MRSMAEAEASKARTSGALNATLSIEREIAQEKADAYNNLPSNIDDGSGVECAKCKNKGVIMRVNDQCGLYVVACECAAKRESKILIRKSGLDDILERYTFPTWETKEKWQKEIRDAAMRYALNPSGWFYVFGRPGTGKTHICTAICAELLERNTEVRYLLWRNFSVRAKSLVIDNAEYSRLLKPYREAKALYIDDLFKSGRGKSATEGDINLAFELLNDRYNDTSKITIISSELSIYDILNIDEGLGSRIYERSKANIFDVSSRDNWRLDH